MSRGDFDKLRQVDRDQRGIAGMVQYLFCMDAVMGLMAIFIHLPVEFFQKNKGTTKLYGTECNNIRFKCKLNGRTFTFKAANILETGIDLEVEQKYLNKTTGLPNEKDIASLAEELTTDLLRQENVIQD